LSSSESSTSPTTTTTPTITNIFKYINLMPIYDYCNYDINLVSTLHFNNHFISSQIIIVKQHSNVYISSRNTKEIVKCKIKKFINHNNCVFFKMYVNDIFIDYVYIDKITTHNKLLDTDSEEFTCSYDFCSNKWIFFNE
jgi:hypothetical protein